MTILEKIIARAQADPDSRAVEERDTAYTYRQLLQTAWELTRELDRRGLNDRPVLVFGRNGFLSLAAMLGSGLSGRAYIPVDAHTPLERAQMILEAAKPAAVITTCPLEPDFQQLLAGQANHLRLDQAASGQTAVGTDDQAGKATGPAFDLGTVDTSRAVRGDQVTYIIYTSGTTGVPKGVAVTEANLASFTDWMTTDFQQSPAGRFLEQPPFSFDLSIFSIYPCLTTGGCLVCLSHEETSNFKQLFDRLNSTSLTTWISTPSFVDICLLDPSFTQLRHPDLAQFIFCGEELTYKSAQKLLTAFPDAAIYNTYGPTEATGAVTSLRLSPQILDNYIRVPLGVAKPGVSISITEGEIIIAGDSVAAGYFENPEKTAAAFFELDGQRAYHTGDAGFIDQQGILNYTGRLDFQVKFNGFRIELQDIEANLLELPYVSKALVLPKVDDAHKVTGLVAALVVTEPSPDRDFTKRLKRDLAPLIMDYMMPTKFVYLDDFPLNDNGKVDRAALGRQIL